MQNEQIENFKIYLQQLGYSKSSIQMLPACVLDFLGQVGQPNMMKINQQHILDFYQYLQNRKHKRKEEALSEIFIHHNIYSLKVFFNWLEQTGQIKINPISNIKFKRPQVNTREPLSQKEINQLFEATQNSKEIAILHLFYSCGLRRTEAENLNTSDIHFRKKLLYVREGKGAKRRVIPITEKVKVDLENYYTHQRPNVNTAAFMLNRSKERMRGESYNKVLKQILKRAELPKEASLHHLRHSIATHLLENGLSVEFVKDFLGHSHLETTQIYTNVSTQQLQNL